MERKIEGLTFQPWVPDAYFESNNPYGKLLILGESHYTNPDWTREKLSTFTIDVIEDFIDESNNLVFYRNFGKSFNQDDPTEIWNYVAFSNAIQVGLANSHAQPTSKQIATIEPALWLLIENLKPQKMIVCSKRMWGNWLPDDDGRCTYVKEIKYGNKKSNVWKYEHSDGFCYAIGINHPSRGVAKDTKGLIDDFLATDFK